MYIVIFWLLVLLDGHKKNKSERLKKFPLVSIAIPAYNEQNTIKKTLSSVINLDYPRGKLEIIVVNDGSKDNTKKVVQDFISTHLDYNIKLINQENRGKGAALNRALKISKGDFFPVVEHRTTLRNYNNPVSINLLQTLPEFQY